MTVQKLNHVVIFLIESIFGEYPPVSGTVLTHVKGERVINVTRCGSDF